jgi:beta-lactamase superfamily II metal-dependent hydrolase
VILVASHHGRENGWCDELRQYCNPAFVVISDKGYQYDTQETWRRYQSIARGGLFRRNNRFVLTTRNDGRIGFTFSPLAWWAY